MVDKNYCMSSYLALRYIAVPDKCFFQGLTRQVYRRHGVDKKVLVSTVEDVDWAIANVFSRVVDEKVGILLSGGMDSACLASYMPKGSIAYTFRFLGGNYQAEELRRAERYAHVCGLQLHYVDIDWRVVESCLDAVMESKGAPVHSIEPQLYYAAKCALQDGVSCLVIGDGADYVFGGMDGLLSKDWKYDEYVDRVTYVKPADVLINPVELADVFEQYRVGDEGVDFLRFYNEIVTDESYASYANAFQAAGIDYIDPYEDLKMGIPLDLERIRAGDTKYIVRELFKKCYPNLPVPEKLPMPRPVDSYFKNWPGVTRREFRNDIDYSKMTGNQKWLLYCLERFLNKYERKEQ